jgi:capsular polysaccharide export protein
VVSSVLSIVLKEKGKLREVGDFEAVSRRAAATSSLIFTDAAAGAPFLRAPPFPGARPHCFVKANGAAADIAELVEPMRCLRVGGSYWGRQPDLPPDHVLVRPLAALGAAEQLADGKPVVVWEDGSQITSAASTPPVIRGECDPWHMLSSASAVVVEPDDELRVIAALMRISCYLYDGISGRLEQDTADAANLLAAVLSDTAFENPFTGEAMSAREAVELCGFWRRLIDSNRDIACGLGFAFWKQAHVAPLLWGGSSPFRFLRSADDASTEAPVAVWGAKTPAESIVELQRRQVPLIEVEDGFLRSRGLGADCIPPLSITVDRLGPHFDPSRPSELEALLEDGQFDEELLERARELRRVIVRAGLGKYGQGTSVLDRPSGDRRHILVPGQVEDDRAVRTGGCGLESNLDLLSRVRDQAPDAFILYKPHPDVLAGHRRGAVSDRMCLQHADQVMGDIPIASLIAMVDEVHVNTSLAGFEALMRGKRVTTYGVPFYAGWGLTHDIGPVPPRRTAKRTIDELVAATLLFYPRYLDPVTGLPCPAEVVVARLSRCENRDPGLLVGMRRLQGKLMRHLRSLVQ